MARDADDDLVHAMQAHHDIVVRYAGELDEAGEALSRLAAKLRAAKGQLLSADVEQHATTVSRIARELALGLEAMQRLVDSARTVRLPISEVARANAEDGDI